MKTTVQLYKKARKNFDIVKSLHYRLVNLDLPQLIYARKKLKLELYNARQNNDGDKIEFCKSALQGADNFIAQTIENIKILKAEIKNANTLLSKIGTSESDRLVHNSMTLFQDILKHQLRNDSITTFDFTTWSKNHLGVEITLSQHA